MVKRRRRPLLLVEPDELIGRCEVVGRDQAQGDRSPQRQLRRLVDRAGRPAPDRPLDPKGPNGRPRRDRCPSYWADTSVPWPTAK